MNVKSWSEGLRGFARAAFMAALLCICGVVLVGQAALGQDMEPPDPDDDYRYWWVANDYIGCSIGFQGSIANEGLNCESSVNPIGKWVVWDPRGFAEGDFLNFPSLIKDCPLSRGPFEWAQYTTIRYREAVAGADPGDFTDAIYGEDAGTRRLGYSNPTTQKVEYVWQLNDALISVGLKFTLERNLVRFDYLIENLSGDATYEVGVRVNVPTALGLQRQAHSYRLPYTAEVTNDSSFEGPDVPDYISAFDSRVHFARSLLLVMGERDATKPDRVVFGTFGAHPGPYRSLWDYRLVPEFDFTWTFWGGCVSMYWDPVSLAPGQQRRIVFYYGTAEATVDAAGPPGQPRDKYDSNHYVLATESPFALRFKQGDDPDTEEEETDATYIDPNPFTIDAYVYNRYEKFGFQQVSVALNLPPGLELMPGEAPSKTINVINAESEGHVSWEVRATGDYTGALEYTVSASPSPAYSKQISRVIEVPAQGDRKVREDWQLISVPFVLQNPDPAAALGLDSFSAYTWDAFEGLYEPVEFIELGRGFWLNAGLETTAELSGARPDAGNFNRIYMIDIDEGWNLIGLPYIYPVYWGKVRVFLHDTQEDITVKEAADRDILRDTLFWYDPYLAEPSYDWDDDVSLLLDPWRGYWIKAYHPCTLLIMPLDNINASKGMAPGGSRRHTSRAEARGVPDGWRLQLIARGESSSDANNFIGISGKAQDSISHEDVEKAPGFFEFVNLAIQGSDSAGRSLALAQDLRSGSRSRKTWDVEVRGKPGEKVTLTWPRIAAIPKDWTLKVIDKKARITKSMRTATRHSFVMSDSGTRALQIVAEPGAGGALLVTGIGASGTRARGSASISYTLSADADAEVTIRSLTGKTIRRLAPTRAAPGVNTQVWDFKDNRGRFVPRGLYLCEVRARNDDDETSRGVAPLLVR